ncbi:MAG TPA: carboxypeptidase-like regulatory domain-containing protein [Gemmatimonadaceae bacterium]|jgi:hypothetical protein|nr:carboxypeptidase-like regulatory domain-containing protein [Gemmatimonadaceae bacterium]
MRLAPVAAVLAALLLVSGSAAGQRTYVAPTRQTVFTTTTEREGDVPGHIIYVENHSTVAIRVFSVTLTTCENVKPSCSVHRTNIGVGAGQRAVALRVGPDDPRRGFSYHFGFSWHADSAGADALNALAESGSEEAKARLAAIRRRDSLDRTEPGVRYNELTRADFGALASRVAFLRASPDSLVLAPGERATVEQIKILVADSQGVVLGRTGWVGWRVPSTQAVQFNPPDNIVANAPGRIVLRFRLAEEAQALLQHPVAELEYPVVVAYPVDPHAPTYQGTAVDADSKTPLMCARVVLEDSAQNVVAGGRTDRAGVFILTAPRPGTHRVRVEAFGWAPVYGPLELARADETNQRQHEVRFAEQLLVSRNFRDREEFEHARPVAVSFAPFSAPKAAPGKKRSTAATPVIEGVTLGGSESMPILGIMSRGGQGTTWSQFVVDSTGHVETDSVLLPPGTDKSAIASVKSVLPRVRFSPARDAGKATCELLRMQVNFSPR